MPGHTHASVGMRSPCRITCVALNSTNCGTAQRTPGPARRNAPARRVGQTGGRRSRSPPPSGELRLLANDDLGGQGLDVVDGKVAGDSYDEIVVQEDHLIRLPMGHVEAGPRRSPVR